MRITNAMMANTTLVNINRNMRYLDKLTQQIASTKKIQVPSDDPIVASRALKYRTSLSETEQFQRNVQSGLSWMNVSESSFTNIVNNLMKQFRERCVEAATGHETSGDKMAIVAELRELIDQIGLEMNQTYAGRYVFSGFRTDEPPVLIESNNNSYVITQEFSITDVEKTKSYQKIVSNEWNDPTHAGDDYTTLAVTPPSQTDEPIVHKINVLKLAYKNVDTDAAGDTCISIPGYNVVTLSNSDIRTYDPDYLASLEAANGPTIIYVPETSEMILSDTGASMIPLDGLSVTYQKSNYEKGELNPLVYFDCRDITANPAANISGNTYQMTQYFLPSDGAANTPVTGLAAFDLAYKGITNPVLPNGYTLSSLTTAPTSAAALADGEVYIDAATGKVIMNEETAAKLQGFYVTYDKTGINTTTELNPFVNTAVQAPKLLSGQDPYIYYNMDKQDVKYEFATNTYITINSQSKNVYTDKMYADLVSLCDFAVSLSASDEKLLQEMYQNPPYNLTGDDLQNAVDKQLTSEKAQLQAVLHDRFNNMLYLVDRHSENVMKEQTQLGSRMQRLELIEARLEQDESSYTKLLSDNEDTNLVKAIISQATAEAAYQASLQVGANIVQLTLANYIG